MKKIIPAANTAIDVQVATTCIAPDEEQLKLWANAALAHEHITEAELTIRLVDEAEIIELNQQYRNKNKPTNVLSFPAEVPVEVELDIPLLGDIIICAAVVEQEAKTEEVNLKARWAHMVVHGVMHLLGYDHVADKDAKIMEEKESQIMQALDFEDPYQ